MIKLKNDFLIQRILLLSVFFFPWSFINFEYELHLKEIFVGLFFLYIVLLSIVNNKSLNFRYESIFYFLFVLLCIPYYFFEINNLNLIQSLENQNSLKNGVIYAKVPHLTHVLISTVLNFLIFFTFSNIKIDSIRLNLFVLPFFVIYLLIGIYFIFYSYNIHLLSEGWYGVTPYQSYLLALERANDPNFHTYFGGTNGRSLFYAVLTSFFVGFYLDKGRYYIALFCIILSIVACSLMMSRSAIIFLSFLLLVVLFNKASITQVLVRSIFLVFLSLILIYFNYESLSFGIDGLLQKSLNTYRGMLVIEALDLTSKNYFLGTGFQASTLNKLEFSRLGFNFISMNGPQNTYISILMELGVIGLFLFCLFLLYSYKSFSKSIRTLEKCTERNFISGAKFMVLAIAFYMLFIHSAEQNFLYFPIFMLILGTSLSLIINQNTKIDT